jgi:glycosyltransferase involved in cell wall biosynthesis
MESNLKILHMVPALFGKDGITGGAERYALELAKHMANVSPTRLLTFGESDRDFMIDSLSVRVLGNPYRVRNQRNNNIHSGMLKEFRKANVIHCHQHHLLASSCAALYSMIFRRKCFVSDLGGGGWDISGYIPTDSWFRGHLHISQYSRKIFGHEHRQNASVIMGGVDTEKFSPNPSTPRENLVVYAGRLMPHKGVNDLVEALPDGMRLELIGQPYHERFVKDLQRLAAGKEVQFRHDCRDEELVNAFRRATCVVLPSVYKTCYGETSEVPELLGQTLIEGMACGTPAICTNVASMPEVVVDGVTGFVVPPNDPASLRIKLEQLRDDASLVSRLGREARQHVVSHFHWDRVVQKCMEAYSR